MKARILVIALLAALLPLFGSTNQASAAPRVHAAPFDLTVSYSTDYGYAYTEFTSTAMYVGEHSIMSGSLVNAATGASVAGFYPPRKGGGSATRVQGAVPAGPYTLTLTDTVLGHWSCSIYNEDGCSWIDEWSTTYVWKFHWAGSGTITVPRWDPQPTVKGRARMWRIDRTTCRVKGRVISRTENADFTMGPWTAHKRTVKVQSKSGFWYTKAKVKSKPNGKFDLRFRCGQPQRWRVLIPEERGLPGATVTFSHKK